eukprot:5765733-Pleurochrysis_carterae.AAC.1
MKSSYVKINGLIMTSRHDLRRHVRYCRLQFCVTCRAHHASASMADIRYNVVGAECPECGLR